MLAAINSVQADHMSGNKAADLHGVPRSTLKADECHMELKVALCLTLV